MTPTKIQEIREALHARADDGQTHWDGCEAVRSHRDCAIARLLTAWDTRDTALRSLVQQWREQGANEITEALDQGLPAADGVAAMRMHCADALARLLTSEDH